MTTVHRVTPQHRITVALHRLRVATDERDRAERDLYALQTWKACPRPRLHEALDRLRDAMAEEREALRVWGQQYLQATR